MSLVTRCPACQTAFRVVPDQLRISQGWVRCGQCAEIFDASQHLQEPGTAAAPAPAPDGGVHGGAPGSTEPQVHDAAASAPGPSAAAPLPASADPVDREAPGMDAPLAADAEAPTLMDMAPPWLQAAPPEIPVTDPVASLDVEFAEYQQAQPPAGELASDPMPGASDAAHGHDADTGAPSAAPGDAAAGAGRLYIAPVPSAAVRPRSAASLPSDTMSLLRRPAAEAPDLPPRVAIPAQTAAPPPPRPLDPAVADLSFMRDAPSAVPAPQRSASRRRTPWLIGIAALALLWLLQVAVHERDRIAAAAPAMRPVVQALCMPLGCSIQAPRRIESVVIDGSSFHALGDDGYRLSLTLRNRAPHPVAMPAVVLALTDFQEQPVVRRVLLPGELGTPPPELPAHGEWTTSVDLRMADNAGRTRVVGYRLDAFYP